MRSPAQKRLGDAPHIHETSRVRDSVLGPWTDIGPNCSISESTVGDYTYCAGDVSIIYSEVGKFGSIASHVRLNPGNHPMQRVTQHHMTTGASSTASMRQTMPRSSTGAAPTR